MERSRSQGLGISIATPIHFCTGLSTTSDRSGNIWRNNIASSKISISDHCGWRKKEKKNHITGLRGGKLVCRFSCLCDFVITHWVFPRKNWGLFGTSDCQVAASFRLHILTIGSTLQRLAHHWSLLRILEVKIDEPALKLSTDMYGHPRLSESGRFCVILPSSDSTEPEEFMSRDVAMKGAILLSTRLNAKGPIVGTFPWKWCPRSPLA